MSTQLMTSEQESTPCALWVLAPGEALRLDIGPGERELHVAQGRVWLTRSGTPRAPAEDVWLSAGESLALACGSAWVVEGWGVTQFQLLVPPRVCAAASRLAKFSAPSWPPLSVSLAAAG